MEGFKIFLGFSCVLLFLCNAPILAGLMLGLIIVLPNKSKINN